MRFTKIWIACMVALLIAGCQAESTNTSKDVGQVGEKEIKEKTIQYIKKTYNKKFEVTKIECVKEFESNCFITGNVKDGKNTEITVYWMPPNEIKDDYVITLWDDELEPQITTMIHNHMDVRRIDEISYNNGTKKDKYTGEIPSVFDVLKNGGDREYSLTITLRIYEEDGQYEKALKEFLQKMKAMNFNRVVIEVFVADDKLKSAPKDAEESNYTLYRYNINVDDIQKIDIDNLNLDQYKTVIKH